MSAWPTWIKAVVIGIIAGAATALALSIAAQLGWIDIPALK